MPLTDAIENIKQARREEIAQQKMRAHDLLYRAIRSDLGKAADSVEIKISGGIADIIAPGHKTICAMFDCRYVGREKPLVYFFGDSKSHQTMSLADALIAAEIREG